MLDLCDLNEPNALGASAPVPVSEPLPNLRWEIFCRALSRAAPPSLVDAYFEAAQVAGQSKPKATTARVAASNLSRKPIIGERIRFLRQERLDGTEEVSPHLDERRIQELLTTCSEALVNAAKAADAAGLGASQVTAIRKSIVVHEGRRTRSQVSIADDPPTEPDFKLNVPGWCNCACSAQ